MEALLEASSDSEVKSEDEISPNLIDPEFEKTGKLNKDKNVSEEKETAESKVDNAEEDRESITSIKKKDDIVNAYINSIKRMYDTVDKVDKSRATSVSNIPNEITQLENITKTSGIIIPTENLGTSLASVTPDQNAFIIKIREVKHHVFRL